MSDIGTCVVCKFSIMAKIQLRRTVGTEFWHNSMTPSVWWKRARYLALIVWNRLYLLNYNQVSNQIVYCNYRMKDTKHNYLYITYTNTYSRTHYRLFFRFYFNQRKMTIFYLFKFVGSNLKTDLSKDKHRGQLGGSRFLEELLQFWTCQE